MQEGKTRDVVTPSGDTYLEVWVEGDSVCLRFSRASVNNYVIRFSKKALPQLIPILQEINSEVE